MSHYFSTSQFLEISGPNASTEIEVSITCKFIPGCREQGPTYACGGQPAEPACVEDMDFEAFEIVSKNNDGKGPWVRGPKIEMSPWLEAFIEKAIDEDELLADAREDA